MNSPHSSRGIELVDKSNLAEARSFLFKHDSYSLFLLGNLEAHGPHLTASPNSGNYKLIRADGIIVAIICLTRRGNLVVHSTLSERWLLELIVSECKKENIPLSGLLGEWNLCLLLWDLLKQEGIIQQEGLISKEILYAVDIKPLALPGCEHVRLLRAEDYCQWEKIRIDYIKEEGLPNDLSKEQLHNQFLENVGAKIAWGYFLNDTLVSVAELNARAGKIAQVGGVCTPPPQRKKGFARGVMQQLMKECREIHHIEKLIIFTGDSNTPARRLYESLGVHPVGYYALMFKNLFNIYDQDALLL